MSVGKEAQVQGVRTAMSECEFIEAQGVVCFPQLLWQHNNVCGQGNKQMGYKRMSEGMGTQVHGVVRLPQLFWLHNNV